MSGVNRGHDVVHVPSRSPVSVGLAVGAVAAVVVLLGLAGLFAGGWKAVPPDKLMLHYTGGPIQGTHFKEEVDPGTRTKFYGIMEHFYYLPSTQRTYIVSKDPAAGDVKGVDYLSAPSSDNVPFSFEAATYFKLNTNPKILRQFFEQICLHDHCTDLSDGGGWDRMLAQYFRPQIENALRVEVERYDRDHLYKDPNTLLTIQKAVGDSLKERITAAVGGEYFCGPDSTRASCTDLGFVLKNPTPPDNVVQAYADNAASAQQVITAQNQAKAAIAKAQGDADAQKARALAPAVPPEAVAYIKAQAEAACASNGNCKLIIIDGNSNTQVQVPSGG